jgi:hypothetical protein
MELSTLKIRTSRRRYSSLSTRLPIRCLERTCSMTTSHSWASSSTRQAQKIVSMSDGQPGNDPSSQVPNPPSAPVGVSSGLYPTDQMGNPTCWVPRSSQPAFPPPGHNNHLAPPQLGYRDLPAPTHNHWGSVNYFPGPLDTTSINLPAFNQGSGVAPGTGNEPANNMANPS